MLLALNIVVGCFCFVTSMQIWTKARENGKERTRVTVSKRANPYMHRSVCNLEMVGWLVPVTRYAGLAEWLPAWNWNGDVHRNTEPYLHWNALCQSHWVSRSMTNPTSNRLPAYLIQETEVSVVPLVCVDRYVAWSWYIFFVFPLTNSLDTITSRFLRSVEFGCSLWVCLSLTSNNLGAIDSDVIDDLPNPRNTYIAYCLT